MFNQDIVKLIFTMETYMAKKGNSIEVKQQLIDSLNIFTKSGKLQAIYVNELDNSFIPDIFIAPMYNKNIGKELSDVDNMTWFDCNYTIEYHSRVFTKYTSEELLTLTISYILQNILSTVAKTRWLMAYNNAIDKHKDSEIMRIFNEIKFSEIAYMLLLDICIRPFVLPNVKGTEEIISLSFMEVLESFGLQEVYYSAVSKALPDNITDVQKVNDLIDRETKRDMKTANMLIDAASRGDIKYYTNMMRIEFPTITMKNILDARTASTGLGFGSVTSNNTTDTSPINEAFNNTEIDVQYKIDKLVTAMRYAENEEDRTATLYKIKLLSVSLCKTRDKLVKANEKSPNKNNYEKILFYNSKIDELDELRNSMVHMEIKPKKFGVFIKYPEGYDY